MEIVNLAACQARLAWVTVLMDMHGGLVFSATPIEYIENY